jgi:predicted O-methyltransferase YrrM
MIAVDDCHAELIASLVKCHKPRDVLELGIGSGKSSREIIKALEWNTTDYKYTLVDSGVDWGSHEAIPRDAIQHLDGNQKARLIISDELPFVMYTPDKYDFIFSDADHWNTDKWFDYVYTRLLKPGGILIYHDVSMQGVKDDLSFPNLDNIFHRARELGLHYAYFNKSSRQGEKCERGLFVLFKH